MLIGARTGAWSGGAKKKPTARDYVQDGLVAMFDCRENLGYDQFDGVSRKWVDCVGGISCALTGNVNWTDAYFQGDGSSYFRTADARIQDLINTASWTVEILVRAQIGGSNGGILGIGTGGTRNLWIWERNNTARPNEPYIDAIQTQFGNLGRPTIGYDRWVNFSLSCNNGLLNLYVNNISVGSTYGSLTVRSNSGFTLMRIDPYSNMKSGVSCYRFYNHSLSDADRNANYAFDNLRYGPF